MFRLILILLATSLYACSPRRAPPVTYVSHPTTEKTKALLKQGHENRHPITLRERGKIKRSLDPE